MDRVRVIAAKMANSVTQVKRKGNFVVRELLKALFYEDGEYKNKYSLRRKFVIKILIVQTQTSSSAQCYINKSF